MKSVVCMSGYANVYFKTICECIRQWIFTGPRSIVGVPFDSVRRFRATLQHTQITTPSQNKKQKIHISLRTVISATHWYHQSPHVEVSVGALSYHPVFFMTFPNCHRYSLSIDCIQIRSINWLYGAYKAQGILTETGSPDKEDCRVLWITLREESYWGSMTVLSPIIGWPTWNFRPHYLRGLPPCVLLCFY